MSTPNFFPVGGLTSTRPPQTFNKFPQNQFLDSSSSIVISSADITDPDEKNKWEYLDPPPTELKVTLPNWPLGKSVGSSNTQIKVYLRKYFFDCVWRDSSNPEEYITSNSGTSVAKKIMLTFFVGPQGTTRLLKPNIEHTATSNVDVIITRNQGVIGESASNPYSTVETTNVDLYFENQFTNMNEYLGQPGLFIGYVDSQALSALKANTVVTVKITTDRDDYPSPFWFRKFLTGVSLYNPLIHQFEVVESGTEIKKYYKRLKRVQITRQGGPYMPTGLATLERPIRFTLHRFINNATIDNIEDPLLGEFVVSQTKDVTVRICQVGLLDSGDLSTFDKRGYNSLLCPSDESSFSINVYDPTMLAAQTFTIADQSGDKTPLNRFIPHSQFRFPNGVWKGDALNAKITSVNTYSCFPFEQRLKENTLRVVNDTVSYNAAILTNKSTRYEIIPNHLYFFMDGGSSWLEDSVENRSFTTSERSLQFDLGRQCFINKIQLLFPRSQESFQPVRMAASLQHKFSTDSRFATDAPEAIWFGNYQHDTPFGKRIPDNQVTGDYEYLNTHTQMKNSLHRGSVQLMNVKEYSSPYQHFYSGKEYAPNDIYDHGGPKYLSETRGGRYSVVVPNASDESFVEDQPNIINPSTDFYRQEYGPFVRGCTIDELFDTQYLKAITFLGENALWETVEQPNGRFFYTPETFILTENASIMSKTCIYYPNTDGVYEKLLNTPTNQSILLDSTTTKYIYPYDMTEFNELLVIDHFNNLASYLFSKYSIYLVTGESRKDYPMPEYIVKESYYFAPWYNQYVTNTASTRETLRPPESELGQKMVNEEYAQGRYFGFTCGSFLNDSTTHRQSRGIGNKIRMYSVRPCTQLFSFVTNGGFVIDDAAEITGTFRKQYIGGVLTECLVENPGKKYLKDIYSSDSVKMYKTLANNYQDAFIDSQTGEVVDRTETLLTANVEALNNTCSNIGLDTFANSQPVKLEGIMEDDVGLNEYTFYLKAATKTSLRRFMEIQLDVDTS